jgi:FKBP-type peptidyl-prolyl cis-trans isomerase FkpA
MKTLNALVALLLALSISACNAKKEEKEQAPMTEEQKTLHSLGVLMSQNIKTFDLSPEEVKFVQQGLADGLSGKTKPEEVQDQFTKLQELERTRREAAGKKLAAAGTEYLEKAAKEQGATKTASGMVIKHTQVGTGESPKPDSDVKVHYEGRLIDGKVFDSSMKRGQPIDFKLSGVIPCWIEGVQTMKVGGKAQFVCPPNLAYGEFGSPPTIPPQATLVFDVELLEINK